MRIEIVVIILCGVGTFLLRFLPIWRVRQRASASAPASPRTRVLIQRFFSYIGPAALTALLLISLWPFFRHAQDTPRLLSTTLALLVIYLGKRWTRNLAGSTLLGALAYGLMMQWLV